MGFQIRLKTTLQKWAPKMKERCWKEIKLDSNKARHILSIFLILFLMQ